MDNLGRAAVIKKLFSHVHHFGFADLMKAGVDCIGKLPRADILWFELPYGKDLLASKMETLESILKQITDKYSSIVTKNKGEIVQTQNWGLLSLAYLIKKNKKGNYIHFKIKGHGKIIKELEKNERIDKNLLRYLTVKVKKFDLDTNYFSKKEDGDKKKSKEV